MNKMGNSEKNEDVTYNDVFDFYFTKRDCKPIIPHNRDGGVISKEKGKEKLDNMLKKMKIIRRKFLKKIG